MKTFLLLLALFTGSANAANMVNGALAKMINNDDPTSSAVAVGYVLGIADAHKGTRYCPPAAGLHARVIVSAVMKSPQFTYFPNVASNFSIPVVLEGKWPCNGKKP